MAVYDFVLAVELMHAQFTSESRCALFTACTPQTIHVLDLLRDLKANPKQVWDGYVDNHPYQWYGMVRWWYARSNIH
jgi:hypothetical protein